MLGFSSSSSSRFSGTITQDQQLPLSPPHILGGGVFDVGSEFVNAASCAVPAADLAFVHRAGENGRNQQSEEPAPCTGFSGSVSAIYILRLLYVALRERAYVCCAGLEPNLRRRRRIDRSSRDRKHQFAVSEGLSTSSVVVATFNDEWRIDVMGSVGHRDSSVIEM